MRRVCQCDQGIERVGEVGYVILGHGREEENDVNEGQHLSCHASRTSHLETNDVDVVGLSCLHGMVLPDLLCTTPDFTTFFS